MKKESLIIVKLLIISQLSFSQSVTIVPTNPANPSKGTIDFNNATNQLQYWNSAAWIPITNAASGTGWTLSGSNINNNNSGNVGIGTNTPKAVFNVAAGKTVLFGEDTTGGGKKLIWYANKGAFRVGEDGVSGFDYTNVGYNSMGLGRHTKASGDFSVAIGFLTTASGDLSTALGHYTQAMGNSSTSLGYFTTANGEKSMAMGEDTKANGITSTAMGRKTVADGKYSLTAGNEAIASGEGAISMGYQTLASKPYAIAIGVNATASGNNSIALGNNTVASGLNTTAMGYNTVASGINSTSIGYSSVASGVNSTAMGVFANTNQYQNSFCIAGTAGNIVTTNTTENQMMMRFDNYTFYVAGTNNYAYIIPASNGWAYTSDSNKKENFEELNGETVLKKISKIPFYSWNFKDKTVKQYRHYGIIAQDFYQNFGKDGLGVIGNDTTVSALDLLGVAYSGIKALEKRTEELQIQNNEIRIKNNDLGIKNEEFRIINKKLEARLENIEKILMAKKEN